MRTIMADACLPVSWASDFCMVDLGVRNMYLPCMDFKRSYHWRLIQEYFRCLQFYHEQSKSHGDSDYNRSSVHMAGKRRLNKAVL